MLTATAHIWTMPVPSAFGWSTRRHPNLDRGSTLRLRLGAVIVCPGPSSSRECNEGRGRWRERTEDVLRGGAGCHRWRPGAAAVGHGGCDCDAGMVVGRRGGRRRSWQPSSAGTPRGGACWRCLRWCTGAGGGAAESQRREKGTDEGGTMVGPQGQNCLFARLLTDHRRKNG
jgi:hypothetical protein